MLFYYAFLACTQDNSVWKQEWVISNMASYVHALQHYINTLCVFTHSITACVSACRPPPPPRCLKGYAATCVSHQCWLYFSLSASLRRRGRDLRRSLVCDVILSKAKVRYVSRGRIQKPCCSIWRLLCVCVWPDVLHTGEGSVDPECVCGAVQVAGSWN